MTLTDAAVVRFCQQTGVHSTLARHAIVRPLVDEALQRRFPMLQVCCAVVTVVGADAVIVVVSELTRLPWSTHGAHGKLHLLALRDLFDPRSLTGGPQAPYHRLGNTRGGCGNQAPRTSPLRHCVSV
jgi:hypothetical protein